MEAYPFLFFGYLIYYQPWITLHKLSMLQHVGFFLAQQFRIRLSIKIHEEFSCILHVYQVNEDEK